MARKSTKSPRDPYQEVTDRIVEALEKGTAPWVRPWSLDASGFPRNGSSQREYNGINVLLLWMTAQARGFVSNEWFTFKQAKELGGTVRKGEQATMITFWNILEREDEHGEEKKIPLLRFFYVFNREQCDNLPPSKHEAPEHTERPITERCESVSEWVRGLGVSYKEGGNRAFYSPREDRVQMPKRSQFETDEHYASTLLHETGHWTGHESRLKRLQPGTTFGSESYAEEELIAELYSAFMCTTFAISAQLRHAEYIGSWIRKLKEDKRAIFRASTAAKKAAEWSQEQHMPAHLEEAEV